MPPVPMGALISYGPRRAPAARAMRGPDAPGSAHCSGRGSSRTRKARWLSVPLARSLRVVGYDLRAPSSRQPALDRSNGKDSRKRLQSGLRLGLAQRLPVAVGALVAEVGQVGVLRREQLVFDLGLRP